MSAINNLLAGLIDYAGVFPPASLDMHTAVRNYLEYRGGAYAGALGRFVVSLDRFPYLWDAAGEYVRGLRLSMVAGQDADWDELRRLLDKGYLIESIEIKVSHPDEVERLSECIPAGVRPYFEVPLQRADPELLEAVAAARARVKVRMGGVFAGAFPSTRMVAGMLAELAGRGLAFKATAGLHHPVRARHRLTDAPGSPSTKMHGFFNLACAAAVVYFGGDVMEAQTVLDEEDCAAWTIAPEFLAWRGLCWSAEQLRTVRERFFEGFGSCSFAEPIRDLEAMGWL